MSKKVLLIVLDGVGAGELPDASVFGDLGSNTLANTARAVGGLRLPNLERLGLGNIIPIEGVKRTTSPQAAYGKMAERSGSKDTMIGHWEIAGLITPKPFPTYPEGFPTEVIDPFTKAIGRGILGNVPASGTEVIKVLGMEHIRTGKPIVYTSADSVFQIAAHEEVIPADDLYKMCLTAREILKGEHGVGRVIARPFVGKSPEDFRRTSRRRDFALKPGGETVLDRLKTSGYQVIGVGKIEDIFSGQGLTEAVHTADNGEGIERTIEYATRMEEGLVFTNLVDFDMVFGHRNDAVGFAKALSQFDESLPSIMETLSGDGLLIITADHGNDPTTPSTDHSREYVPLLVWCKGRTKPVDLGVLESFADAGQTIAELFGLGPLPDGRSFLRSARL